MTAANLRESPANAWFAQLRSFQQHDAQERGALPDLSTGQILAWADEHHARTGEWPTCHSGPIPQTHGETWLAVEAALFLGGRGFPGGDTLCRLLEDGRGVRNRSHPPNLSVGQILGWADEHHGRTGAWPHADSGPVAGVPEENWERSMRRCVTARGTCLPVPPWPAC